MDTIKVENGKLTVLKGKMAAGKSMAMLIDAKDYIDFKMGVLFFSLEQSSAKIYDKFFDKVKAKKENSAFMHVIDMASSLKPSELCQVLQLRNNPLTGGGTAALGSSRSDPGPAADLLVTLRFSL